ncbi:NAD(P)-binding domain-containing protein, partial [bacterium]|nr:NAD(P)-binding domain-containing protein [bacterium]
MEVGVLGTGDVGRALATGFISRGHDVKMGSRDARGEAVTAWAKENGKRASAGTFADAAKFGEVVVLATLWSATKSVIDLAGAKNLAGKAVLDVTNPLVMEEGKPPRLALGHTDSGGEQVQRWLPGAKVVKVYNTVGYAHMIDPKFTGGPPDMFICGDDPAAKKKVGEICQSFGWPTIDA